MKLTITRRKILSVVLTLASACYVLAETPKAAPDACQKLNLSCTHIAGAIVYYEKCLEPKLPIFEKAYKKFLAERKKSKLILTRKEKIVADIHHILGIAEPDTEMQDKIWTELLGVFPMKRTIFYLVKQESIKDFLRGGVLLPNFTYDQITDMVEYRPEFKTTSKEGPIEDFEFTFPIASDETFEKNIIVIFQMLHDALGRGNLSVTIHEVVEASLLTRAKPTDPYWRWFSDGFANAITFELLEKHISEENANSFAAAYDVNKYKDFERQINLQYWMSMNFSIKTLLEYENKLTYARYAYSMSEAQRLIEKHGIDCVHRILDEICTQKSRKGSDLVHAIKKVIGEDMQQRLSRYQTFETRKEGIAKYSSLLNAALDKEDYEQMAINTIRLLELQDSPLSPTSLQMRQKTALWLFKLGYEKAADEAMLSFMEELKRNAPQQLYDYFSAGFIVYALQCNKPQKAQSAAEHFLKNHPDHPPALTVRMQLLVDEGELAEARKIAHRICELTEDGSLYHKAAREVLATEPKQQQDKQPIP